MGEINQNEEIDIPDTDADPVENGSDNFLDEVQQQSAPEKKERTSMYVNINPHDEVVEGYLNHADILKMRMIVNLQVFLLLSFFYYVIVVVTASGMEIQGLGISSEVFSMMHFILYVVFVFSVIRVFSSCLHYFGYYLFENDTVGIVAQVLGIFTLLYLYVHHFGLGYLIEDFLLSLPF